MNNVLSVIADKDLGSVGRVTGIPHMYVDHNSISISREEAAAIRMATQSFPSDQAIPGQERSELGQGVVCMKLAEKMEAKKGGSYRGGYLRIKRSRECGIEQSKECGPIHSDHEELFDPISILHEAKSSYEQELRSSNSKLSAAVAASKIHDDDATTSIQFPSPKPAHEAMAGTTLGAMLSALRLRAALLVKQTAPTAYALADALLPREVVREGVWPEGLLTPREHPDNPYNRSTCGIRTWSLQGRETKSVKEMMESVRARRALNPTNQRHWVQRRLGSTIVTGIDATGYPFSHKPHTDHKHDVGDVDYEPDPRLGQARSWHLGDSEGKEAPSMKGRERGAFMVVLQGLIVSFAPKWCLQIFASAAAQHVAGKPPVPRVKHIPTEDVWINGRQDRETVKFARNFGSAFYYTPTTRIFLMLTGVIAVPDNVGVPVRGVGAATRLEVLEALSTAKGRYAVNGVREGAELKNKKRPQRNHDACWDGGRGLRKKARLLVPRA